MASVTVAAATTTGERHLHRFTTDDYHRMGDAGILGPEDRVELLDGEVIEMSPIGSRHAACVKRLIRIFSQRLGDQAILSAQDPILLSVRSEPQPDVALLEPRPDFYTSGHPVPDDVLLLIEVADTTVGFDRNLKMPLYAAGGITEAWLVDLPAGLVVVHRDPAGGGYGDVSQARPGELLSPLAFPDVSFDLAEILP